MITLKKLLYGGLIALLIFLPIHTLITVWLSSLYGHLYVWSGWKEALLLTMSIGGVFLIFIDRKLLLYLRRPLYNRLALGYVCLSFVYVAIQGFTKSSLIGLAFNTRFIVAFWLAQIVAFFLPTKITALQRFVVGLALSVSLFGVLQVTILEPTILTGVGYDPAGVNTLGIPPAIQKVAADSMIYRAQSTLRGPNVLGAYLILPIMLTIYAYAETRRKIILALIPMLAALLLSHSRSAILGLVVGLIFWASLRLKLIKLVAKFKYIALAFAAMLLLAVFFVWPTKSFQTIVLHNSPDIEAVQSNEGHWLQTKQAAKEVATHPLGGGIGSAGPSSAFIDGQNTRIAENYFLQIGQETGWLGLALFLGLQLSVALALWYRRDDMVVQPILAAFIGLTFTNLLLHTWSDEVVSIIAWMTIGYLLVVNKTKGKTEKRVFAKV